MNIELLDEKRVLIDLCVEDMQLLSLEYKTLSMQSPNSRKIIKSLVKIAKVKTGFQPGDNSVVYVEAMPYDGGCFILITLKATNKEQKKFRIVRKPFRKMFCFDSCENMLCAVEKLYINGCESYKSTLIYKDDEYYLLISSPKPVENSINIITNEYAVSKYTNTIKIAHITEYGKVIAEKNAVEKIGRAMCNQ